MRKLLFLPVFIFLVASCVLIKHSELKDETLLTIDGEPTKADDFIYVYEKNNFNNEDIYTAEDIDKYFELFTNFKLKVKAAKDEGINESKAFKEEYLAYKNQLIKPYLAETQAQEDMVREAYERMMYEIDASHILVTVGPNALPQDTAVAYQKILEIHEKVVDGADFGQQAAKFSEDPSAKNNLGRLGYFSVFQMVFPFENAAYNTPVGSVSNIFRTKFGYHILFVHDKRESRGKVKVSHIMIRPDGQIADTVSSKNRIFEIHDQLMSGTDWDELCRRYSDDARTKNTGGTLPFIEIGQINDKAFEDVAFSLQKPGEISDPVRSRYGWHIIKLEEKKGLDPFDQIKDDLEEKVSKDDRSKLSKHATIAKLKAQNNYKLDSATFDQLLELSDSTILHGKWDVSKASAIAEKSLFTLMDKPYDVEQALDYIKIHEKNRQGLQPKQYMQELIEGFVGQTLLGNEEAQLVEGNRDFRMLLNEYYEGILLFDIMNRNVWAKAVEDTVGLREYFENHRDKYQWGERVDAAILTTSSLETFKKLQKSMVADEEVMDLEGFLLYDLAYDVTKPNDILSDAAMDTLINLSKTYRHSTITLFADDESRQTPLYIDILSYLKDLGITPKTDLTSSSNKIRVQLNSKSKKSLEFLYNKESALTLQVAEGLFERGNNLLIDSLSWEKGAFEVVSDGNYNLVLIQSVLEPQPKSLEETKGSVISDYQNYLEKEWVKKLKEEHTIDINTRILDKIKKSYSK